jgi:hypothetical protein
LVVEEEVGSMEAEEAVVDQVRTEEVEEEVGSMEAEEEVDLRLEVHRWDNMEEEEVPRNSKV